MEAIQLLIDIIVASWVVSCMFSVFIFFCVNESWIDEIEQHFITEQQKM